MLNYYQGNAVAIGLCGFAAGASVNKAFNKPLFWIPAAANLIGVAVNLVAVLYKLAA